MLDTAVKELTSADEALDAAIQELKGIDSPLIQASVTELLAVSDRLGDAINPLEDIRTLTKG
jgi:hypothetical protein